MINDMDLVMSVGGSGYDSVAAFLFSVVNLWLQEGGPANVGSPLNDEQVDGPTNVGSSNEGCTGG
ncbi:hypothetical protein LINPERHAP1_LOCUS27577 [Linum perenne]